MKKTTQIIPELPPFWNERRFIDLDDVLDLLREYGKPNAGLDPLDFKDFKDKMLSKSHTLEVLNLKTQN